MTDISHGASSHSTSTSSSHIQRPHILSHSGSLDGASVNFALQSSSRVEHRHILSSERVVAWSVLLFRLPKAKKENVPPQKV